MITHYHYTESELKALLQSLTVLIDTREQENGHITSYFEKRNIAYKNRKLDFGDYSVMLPANDELGIWRDLYFDSAIVVERKNSLEELSSNLTNGRAQFESELIRSAGAKVLLMIEGGSYADIIGHKYNTQYEPKAFLAALKTYEVRYGLGINFIPPALAGNFIYHTIYYFLREQLKRIA
ncbi:ERCC4 domain-containing protein [Propionispora vibrioides]|uniref:ERCC4 domain-containing protein n=1 Tax=Propionispora vibrioides TaxID=112903 RepID=A0A1H8Y5N9_9FIRM|nr:ERCC4 domain-containing protein [Propionispora vibrioides]SEP46838.1 ERCC4 domain-containing protein [Propionispora vibrioides]